MKFHYSDKAAARKILQDRLERAESNLTCAKHELFLAKQHLSNTPDSWKWFLLLQDPHSNAKMKVEHAHWRVARCNGAIEEARHDLEVFDNMDGWDFVEIEGENDEND